MPSLTPRQAQARTLRKLGHSYAEIARRLGVSPVRARKLCIAARENSRPAPRPPGAADIRVHSEVVVTEELLDWWRERYPPEQLAELAAGLGWVARR